MTTQRTVRTKKLPKGLLLLLLVGVFVPLAALGTMYVSRFEPTTSETVAPSDVSISYPALAPGPTLGVVIDRSMRVVDIESGSAAEKAGIQRGDVIEALDNSPLASPADAARLIRQSSIGQGVAVTLRRGSQALTVRVIMEQRTPHPNQPTPTPVPSTEQYF